MLYTSTIALSAFLLFLVQPLVSKILLPWFGGGASIWITSLVFFQTMLLVGYGGTHFLVRHLGLRRHMALTIALLIISVAFLPISVNVMLGSDLPPSPRLLLILFMSVGIPYLLLASTSPTLQYWIANDQRTAHRNPYVEYGFSNLGSLLGLLAYPFALEFWLTTTEQSWLWSGLFAGFACLLAATTATFVLSNRDLKPVTVPRDPEKPRINFSWLMLAMIPSALLLTMTQHLTVDVVNLPLLWVAPLCIYLITFILCFLRPSLSTPSPLRTAVGVFAMLGFIVTYHGAFDFSFGVRIAAGLTCLFVVGMICHGDLERAKPHKQDLTGFYLHVSAGGALGSILVGLVAPLLFDSLFEFEIVLIAALYYMVISGFALSSMIKNLMRFGALGSLVAAWLATETISGATIYRERSFFSTYAVRETSEGIPARRLVAGTHVHGEQLWIPEFERVPVAYYHEMTGVGHILKQSKPEQIALVGLGVGSLVEYADEEDVVDIYELDPVVIEIARTQFTVLSESPATVNTIAGDGRITLRAAEKRYDVIALDAFSSGAIPTHLLTVEAVEEMLTKLSDDGVLAFHISNHHVDLLPVLNGVAASLDLSFHWHESSGNDRLAMYPATWVMVSPNKTRADTIANATPGWSTEVERSIVWTDEFSNVWSVLR